MGRRKVIVKQTAADNIAAIAWFIESKGLIATADKFTDAVYDSFIKLGNEIKSYPIHLQIHIFHRTNALLYESLRYQQKGQ